ncbi:MAG: hypothetical protein K2M96_09660 [Prevotella sp.]|nr:hypothetical protein [Prevotella sp.]
MEETMVMDEQPIMNESKKANKANAWKQVTVGGVSGIALGSISTAAVAATTNHQTEEGEAEDTTLSGTNGAAHVDSSVPVAQVSDDMSFSEAFAAAREQVGSGGVFVWHGQVYNTYTAEEWDSMTPAEHAEFGSHVNVVYDEPARGTQTTTQEVPATTQEVPVTTQEVPVTTHEAPVVAVEEPVVEVEPEPQIEVLDYETLTNEDGSQVDLAVISCDGQQVGLYDVNRDGIADLLAMDENNDNQITPNEIEDISEEGISMQPFHDEYIAQNDSSLQGPDYINDGDVESYMA